MGCCASTARADEGGAAYATVVKRADEPLGITFASAPRDPGAARPRRHDDDEALDLPAAGTAGTARCGGSGAVIAAAEGSVAVRYNLRRYIGWRVVDVNGLRVRSGADVDAAVRGIERLVVRLVPPPALLAGGGLESPLLQYGQSPSPAGGLRGSPLDYAPPQLPQPVHPPSLSSAPIPATLPPPSPLATSVGPSTTASPRLGVAAGTTPSHGSPAGLLAPYLPQACRVLYDMLHPADKALWDALAGRLAGALSTAQTAPRVLVFAEAAAPTFVDGVAEVMGLKHGSSSSSSNTATPGISLSAVRCELARNLAFSPPAKDAAAVVGMLEETFGGWLLDHCAGAGLGRDTPAHPHPAVAWGVPLAPRVGSTPARGPGGGALHTRHGACDAFGGSPHPPSDTGVKINALAAAVYQELLYVDESAAAPRGCGIPALLDHALRSRDEWGQLCAAFRAAYPSLCDGDLPLALATCLSRGTLDECRDVLARHVVVLKLPAPGEGVVDAMTHGEVLAEGLFAAVKGFAEGTGGADADADAAEHGASEGPPTHTKTERGGARSPPSVVVDILKTITAPSHWHAAGRAFRARHPRCCGGDLLLTLAEGVAGGGAERARCWELLRGCGVDVYAEALGRWAAAANAADLDAHALTAPADAVVAVKLYLALKNVADPRAPVVPPPTPQGGPVDSTAAAVCAIVDAVEDAPQWESALAAYRMRFGSVAACCGDVYRALLSDLSKPGFKAVAARLTDRCFISEAALAGAVRAALAWASPPLSCVARPAGTSVSATAPALPGAMCDAAGLPPRTAAQRIAGGLFNAMRSGATDEARVYAGVTEVTTAAMWADVCAAFRVEHPGFWGGDVEAALEIMQQAEAWSACAAHLVQCGVAVKAADAALPILLRAGAVSEGIFDALRGGVADADAVHQHMRGVTSGLCWSAVRRDFRIHHPGFHGGDVSTALCERLTGREVAQCRAILQKFAGVNLGPPAVPVDAPHTTRVAERIFYAAKGFSSGGAAVPQLLTAVASPGEWVAIQRAFRAAHPRVCEGSLADALTNDLTGSELAACKDALGKNGIDFDAGRPGAAAATAATRVTTQQAGEVARLPRVLRMADALHRGLLGGGGGGAKGDAVFTVIQNIGSALTWAGVKQAFAARHPRCYGGALVTALRKECSEAERRHCVRLLSGLGVAEPGLGVDVGGRGGGLAACEIAEGLYTALAGFSTDKDAVRKQLRRVTSDVEWETAKTAFRRNHPAMYDGDLPRALREELDRKDVARCVKSLATTARLPHALAPAALDANATPAEHAARAVYCVVTGVSADEAAVAHALAGLTAQQQYDALAVAFQAAYPTAAGGDVARALCDVYGVAEMRKVTQALAGRGVVLPEPEAAAAGGPPFLSSPASLGSSAGRGGGAGADPSARGTNSLTSVAHSTLAGGGSALPPLGAAGREDRLADAIHHAMTELQAAQEQPSVADDTDASVKYSAAEVRAHHLLSTLRALHDETDWERVCDSYARAYHTELPGALRHALSCGDAVSADRVSPLADPLQCLLGHARDVAAGVLMERGVFSWVASAGAHASADARATPAAAHPSDVFIARELRAVFRALPDGGAYVAAPGRVHTALHAVRSPAQWRRVETLFRRAATVIFGGDLLGALRGGLSSWEHAEVEGVLKAMGGTAQQQQQQPQEQEQPRREALTAQAILHALTCGPPINETALYARLRTIRTAQEYSAVCRGFARYASQRAAAAAQLASHDLDAILTRPATVAVLPPAIAHTCCGILWEMRVRAMHDVTGGGGPAFARAAVAHDEMSHEHDGRGPATRAVRWWTDGGREPAAGPDGAVDAAPSGDAVRWGGAAVLSGVSGTRAAADTSALQAALIARGIQPGEWERLALLVLFFVTRSRPGEIDAVLVGDAAAAAAAAGCVWNNLVDLSDPQWVHTARFVDYLAAQATLPPYPGGVLGGGSAHTPVVADGQDTPAPMPGGCGLTSSLPSPAGDVVAAWQRAGAARRAMILQTPVCFHPILHGRRGKDGAPFTQDDVQAIAAESPPRVRARVPGTTADAALDAGVDIIIFRAAVDLPAIPLEKGREGHSGLAAVGSIMTRPAGLGITLGHAPPPRGGSAEAHTAGAAASPAPPALSERVVVVPAGAAMVVDSAVLQPLPAPGKTALVVDMTLVHLPGGRGGSSACVQKQRAPTQPGAPGRSVDGDAGVLEAEATHTEVVHRRMPSGVVAGAGDGVMPVPGAGAASADAHGDAGARGEEEAAAGILADHTLDDLAGLVGSFGYGADSTQPLSGVVYVQIAEQIVQRAGQVPPQAHAHPQPRSGSGNTPVASGSPGPPSHVSEGALATAELAALEVADSTHEDVAAESDSSLSGGGGTRTGMAAGGMGGGIDETHAGLAEHHHNSNRALWNLNSGGHGPGYKRDRVGLAAHAVPPRGLSDGDLEKDAYLAIHTNTPVTMGVETPQEARLLTPLQNSNSALLLPAQPPPGAAKDDRDRDTTSGSVSAGPTGPLAAAMMDQSPQSRASGFVAPVVSPMDPLLNVTPLQPLPPLGGAGIAGGGGLDGAVDDEESDPPHSRRGTTAGYRAAMGHSRLPGHPLGGLDGGAARAVVVDLDRAHAAAADGTPHTVMTDIQSGAIVATPAHTMVLSAPQVGDGGDGHGGGSGHMQPTIEAIAHIDAQISIAPSTADASDVVTAMGDVAMNIPEALEVIAPARPRIEGVYRRLCGADAEVVGYEGGEGLPVWLQVAPHRTQYVITSVSSRWTLGKGGGKKSGQLTATTKHDGTWYPNHAAGWLCSGGQKTWEYDPSVAIIAADPGVGDVGSTPYGAFQTPRETMELYGDAAPPRPAAAGIEPVLFTRGAFDGGQRRSDTAEAVSGRQQRHRAAAASISPPAKRRGPRGHPGASIPLENKRLSPPRPAASDDAQGALRQQPPPQARRRVVRRGSTAAGAAAAAPPRGFDGVFPQGVGERGSSHTAGDPRRRAVPSSAAAAAAAAHLKRYETTTTIPDDAPRGIGHLDDAAYSTSAASSTWRVQSPVTQTSTAAPPTPLYAHSPERGNPYIERLLSGRGSHSPDGGRRGSVGTVGTVETIPGFSMVVATVNHTSSFDTREGYGHTASGEEELAGNYPSYIPPPPLGARYGAGGTSSSGGGSGGAPIFPPGFTVEHVAVEAQQYGGGVVVPGGNSVLAGNYPSVIPAAPPGAWDGCHSSGYSSTSREEAAIPTFVIEHPSDDRQAVGRRGYLNPGGGGSADPPDEQLAGNYPSYIPPAVGGGGGGGGGAYGGDGGSGLPVHILSDPPPLADDATRDPPVALDFLSADAPRSAVGGGGAVRLLTSDPTMHAPLPGGRVGLHGRAAMADCLAVPPAAVPVHTPDTSYDDLGDGAGGVPGDRNFIDSQDGGGMTPVHSADGSPAPSPDAGRRRQHTPLQCFLHDGASGGGTPAPSPNAAAAPGVGAGRRWRGGSGCNDSAASSETAMLGPPAPYHEPRGDPAHARRRSSDAAKRRRSSQAMTSSTADQGLASPSNIVSSVHSWLGPTPEQRSRQERSSGVGPTTAWPPSPTAARRRSSGLAQVGGPTIAPASLPRNAGYDAPSSGKDAQHSFWQAPGGRR